jgi:hypothetical protein
MACYLLVLLIKRLKNSLTNRDKDSDMDLLESLELSLCITLGVLVFSNTLYSLCTLYPGDVLELAKYALP